MFAVKVHRCAGGDTDVAWHDESVSDQTLELLTPASDSVFIIIEIGFSESFWGPFACKADRNWLSGWLELLPALELLFGSTEVGYV